MESALFIPGPMDTSGIGLPSDLNDLIEVMAHNTHDVWAKQRLSEGWKYGKERNDKLKTHPCLIPYECLPDNEKDYDRNTSIETLKFIIGNGYVIRKDNNNSAQ